MVNKCKILNCKGNYNEQASTPRSSSQVKKFPEAEGNCLLQSQNVKILKSIEKNSSPAADIGLRIMKRAHFQLQYEASGRGKSRQQCLTHDTKRVLVQTIPTLSANCWHLLTNARFKFVPLRKMHNDRIEAEFLYIRNRLE
ncbi:hypothetical protein PoB_006331600 [Plakobranchus ocellatus]|uniref:Transposase n=1 Tax=Plakobranchus ocellatus TaxID=259542 RepID=A0AAV4CYK0_9GAST|nr:hypothetical protein PoB_006331600 [Plakobranchus ocellatus]